MIRLLSIEYLKLKPARYFWVLMILFFAVMVGIPIATYALGDWIVNELLEDESTLQSIVPFYDFADIWHNFTFLFQYFTVLLSCLVVINVAQEFSLQTARQNVIDGMSRREFFMGKILFILTMAAGVTVVVFILGMIFGLLYSPVTDAQSIFMNIEFLGAYFLHLVQAFLFAMFIALLVRRTGIGAVVLMFYMIIEAFLALYVEYGAELYWLARSFPSASARAMINTPFPKYFLWETINYIRWEDFLIQSLWIIGLFTANYALVRKRDL